MIVNIVDRRPGIGPTQSEYNVEIDAIFEPACHDNSCKGATQFPAIDDSQFYYRELHDTSIELALNYAQEQWPLTPTTLFIYPKGFLARDRKRALEEADAIR